MSSGRSRPPKPTRAAVPPPGDWVIVGTVTAPHGVRGEVRVLPTAERPGRLCDLRTVTLALPNGRLLPVRLVGHRAHQGQGVDLLSFEGYTDRTAAESLRGALLLVAPGESPPLPEGEYYEWQIVGLRVVTTHGRELGVVEQVLRTGANDVYAVGEHLLPATAEVVKQINLAEQTMVVEPMPGLLDGEEREARSEERGVRERLEAEGR